MENTPSALKQRVTSALPYLWDGDSHICVFLPTPECPPQQSRLTRVSGPELKYILLRKLVSSLPAQYSSPLSLSSWLWCWPGLHGPSAGPWAFSPLREDFPEPRHPPALGWQILWNLMGFSGAHRTIFCKLDQPVFLPLGFLVMGAEGG